MLFNSYAFLFVFLPVAIAACAVADPHPKARMPVLIALSLAFYSYWDIRFLPIMIGSILGNWLLIRAFVATKRPGILTSAIVLDLAALGVFKYTDFFAGTVAYLIGKPLPHLALVLPLGISFFTFHHIMYLVDLRRGVAPIFPLDRYALYICFFPQAISGPIARWSEVMHQFGRRAFAPGWQQRCAVGLTFIIIGLLQKTVLADPLSQILENGREPRLKFQRLLVGVGRNLFALLPSFGQADRDGLLAARHFLSAAAALQLALMHFVHLALYLLACSFAVLAPGTLF